MSNCAEEYGISIRELLHTVQRHHHAVVKVILRAPVVVDEVELDSSSVRNSIQHLDRLVHHVNADPVSPDNGYVVLRH